MHIEARRWFQKTYGNTYHSVTIHPSGKGDLPVPLRCDFAYGYGDGYLQTAWSMLQEAGAIPKDRPYGGTRALREEFGFTWSVADVARKRDL